MTTKFEYKLLIKRESLEEWELNDLGKEGWELCGCVPADGAGTITYWPIEVRYYFKRTLSIS
jgi:hypothetical protein